MDNVMRILHRFANKFLKKKRRLSIEGREKRIVIVPCPPAHLDETAQEENDVPPLTPALTRCMARLRASTPIKTRGILIFEGDTESMNEGGASQAEDCAEWEEWNATTHNVPVDSADQFVVDGGDKSSSLECEEKVGEMVHKRSVDLTAGFLFDDEYEEDSFDVIADYQRSFLYSTTWETDDEEGYEWEVLRGQSTTLVPHHLSFPLLCNFDEETLRCVTRAAISEDESVMSGRKGRQWTPPLKQSACVSTSVSPSRRPDTPTTNEDDTVATSGDISDGNGHSPVATVTSSILTRPSCARDEDNEWLLSMYEQSALGHEIPHWIRVDHTNNKKMIYDEDSMLKGVGWITSTPVCTMPSPAFSSMSTIGRFNDSANSLNGSLLVGGKMYYLDVSVRERAILARPMVDYLQTTFGIDDDLV